MHQVISLAEAERWEREVALMPRRDAFYRHAYAALCHAEGDGDPFLFVYDDGAGGRVWYVYVRRPLAALPEAAAARLEGDWYDTITPNRGYGGPVCAVEGPELLAAFRAAFDAHAREAHLVTEFVRFHPLLENHRHLGGAMQVRYDRETVCVDLTRDADALLARYHHRHRDRIRKAQASGLRFQLLEGAAAAGQVAAFYPVYRATMDRVGSTPYWYHSEAYLRRLFAGFGDAAVLGAVFDGARLVGGAVCLRDPEVLHYWLSGSDADAQRLGTNPFLLHHLALWAKGRGCRGFFLGGGHVGRDSLFLFKYRFDPDGLRGYHVGTRVHLPEVQARLVEGWRRVHGAEPPAHFFPPYRAAPPRPVAAAAGLQVA